MAKDAIAINPARSWMEMLQFKEPALFAHGNNWAIEAVIADRLGMPRPRTPLEAKAAGGSAGIGEKKVRTKKSAKAK